MKIIIIILVIIPIFIGLLMIIKAFMGIYKLTDKHNVSSLNVKKKIKREPNSEFAINYNKYETKIIYGAIWLIVISFIWALFIGLINKFFIGL